MKKMIFAAFATLCLVAGTQVYAQEQPQQPAERPTAEQMARRMTDRMTERLKLTEAQAEQVYAVNLEQIQAMEAQREAMRKMRSEQAEKMKSVLTTEQFMEWSKMQAPRHDGRRAPGMRRGAPDGAKCCDNACPQMKKGDKPCPRKNKRVGE